MNRHVAIWAITATAALGLAACSSGETSADQPASEGFSNSQASSPAEGPTVEILDSGFGQNDIGTQGIAVVTTDDEAAIREMVTVTANFLDADGEILATEEQIESFSWVGQELVMPISVFLDDPAAEVASIDVSASLSDYGAGQALEPLPTLDASEVATNEFGTVTAAFEFTNETGADLEDLRVGVVCYDDAENIIGGAYAYPSLVPSGKSIRIEADPIVSGDPASCKAFPGYGVSA